MPERSPRRILAAGDAAFVVEFGSAVDQDLFTEVEALDRHLQQLHRAGKLPGLCETVPTFRSLAVIFDPLITTPDELLAIVDGTPQETAAAQKRTHREWRIPVCYGGPGGPDLAEVAALTDLCEDEVVAQHLAQAYSVYMLGFQPGFAFMGDLPPTLHLPRRPQPRTRVPPGSVAIANQLTSIYPWESPGGWHLIGYCPIPLFDGARPIPALLRAGDQVRFHAIDSSALAALENDIDRGCFDTDTLQG